MLEEAGFTVEKVELEYRPTKLNSGQGLAGWIRLFAAQCLAELDETKRNEVVQHAVQILQWSTNRADDAEVIGYARLRAVALKNGHKLR